MLHEWIRKQRLAAGLTQAQVAEALGVSQPWVSRVEKGEIQVRITTLRRLGEVIGFNPAKGLENVGPSVMASTPSPPEAA